MRPLFLLLTSLALADAPTPTVYDVSRGTCHAPDWKAAPARPYPAYLSKGARLSVVGSCDEVDLCGTVKACDDRLVQVTDAGALIETLTEAEDIKARVDAQLGKVLWDVAALETTPPLADWTAALLQAVPAGDAYEVGGAKPSFQRAAAPFVSQEAGFLGFAKRPDWSADGFEDWKASAGSDHVDNRVSVEVLMHQMDVFQGDENVLGGPWEEGWTAFVVDLRGRILQGHTAWLQPKLQDSCEGRLCIEQVDGLARRVTFALREMPPSRLTCELYHQEGARASLVWDPLLGSPLSQTVTLPEVRHTLHGSAFAVWSLGCWSKPSKVQMELEHRAPLTVQREEAATEAGGAAAVATSDEPFYARFDGHVDLAWTPSRKRAKNPQVMDWGLDPYSTLVALHSTVPDLTRPYDAPVKAVVSFDIPRLNYMSNDQIHAAGSRADRVPTLVVLEDERMLEITTRPLGKLGDEASKEGLMGAYADGFRSGRGLLDSSPPALVIDTLDILAEIASKRAEKAALRALSDQLTHVVCDKMVLEPTQVDDFLILRGGPVLPSTCATVRNMPIEELVNAGPAVVAALERDLASLGYDVLLDSLQARKEALAADEVWTRHVIPLLRESKPIAMRIIDHQEPPGEAEARMLLSVLAAHPWLPESGSQATALECAVDVTVSIASSCVDAGRCSEGLIVSMMRSPDDFFDTGACGAHLAGLNTGTVVGGTDLGALGPELRSLALRLAEAAVPSSDLGERERAVRIVEAYYDLLHLVITHDASLTADQRQVIGSIVAHMKGISVAVLEVDHRQAAKEAFGLLTTVAREAAGQSRKAKEAGVDALVTQAAQGLSAHLPSPADAALACTAAPSIDRTKLKALEQQALDELLGRCESRDEHAKKSKNRARTVQVAMNRTVPWVTVLAAHAEELKTEFETQADADQARAARVEAIEAVIDATTNRSNRDGQVVVSVGANVGAVMQRARCASLTPGLCAHGPLPSMPMGFAVQYLPDRRVPRRIFMPKKSADGVGRSWSLGLHSQVSLVDLTYFVTEYDRDAPDGKVSWNDFAVIGGQAGVIVGTPAIPITASLDYRYRFQESEHQVGLMLGFYVPFLDFN